MVIYSRPAAQAQAPFEGAVAVRERKLPAGRLRFISDAEQPLCHSSLRSRSNRTLLCNDYSSNEIIKLSQ